MTAASLPLRNPRSILLALCRSWGLVLGSLIPILPLAAILTATAIPNAAIALPLYAGITGILFVLHQELRIARRIADPANPDWIVLLNGNPAGPLSDAKLAMIERETLQSPRANRIRLTMALHLAAKAFNRVLRAGPGAVLFAGLAIAVIFPDEILTLLRHPTAANLKEMASTGLFGFSLSYLVVFLPAFLAAPLPAHDIHDDMLERIRQRMLLDDPDAEILLIPKEPEDPDATPGKRQARAPETFP